MSWSGPWRSGGGSGSARLVPRDDDGDLDSAPGAGPELYYLLPRPLPFLSFFVVFLLPQLAALIAQVPGGPGIIETVVVWALGPEAGAPAVAGARRPPDPIPWRAPFSRRCRPPGPRCEDCRAAGRASAPAPAGRPESRPALARRLADVQDVEVRVSERRDPERVRERDLSALGEIRGMKDAVQRPGRIGRRHAGSLRR